MHRRRHAVFGSNELKQTKNDRLAMVDFTYTHTHPPTYTHAHTFLCMAYAQIYTCVSTHRARAPQIDGAVQHPLEEGGGKASVDVCFVEDGQSQHLVGVGHNGGKRRAAAGISWSTDTKQK